MKRVLVVGGGGREHALVRALLRSPQGPEVFCAPGNAGIAHDQVECLEVDAEDVDGIVRAARDRDVGLVVVGLVLVMTWATRIRALRLHGIAVVLP